MKQQYLSLIYATAFCSVSGPVIANDLRDALTNGEVDLSLRYRLEHVDQEDIDKDSLASTLKTRLTYKSQDAFNTQLLLEFDDVHVVGDHNYRAPGQNKDRPVVADAVGTELNQASLTYKGLSDSTIIFGKQRIVLGNQRFVGGVAWRQHEQTYNALTFANQSVADTKLTYSYVDKVNHFVHTADDINTDAHILYVENQSIDKHKITGYAFLLDMTDVPQGVASSQTLGARFEGGFAGLGYALEYAQQSDYSLADDLEGFDVDYQLVEVSYQFSPVKLLAAVEILGSDDGVSFQTPLATKHKFNGWADKFLQTPADGLQDTYVGAVADISGLKVKAFYHQYEADDGNNEYGEEINLAVARKFGQVNTLLKYADYSADEDDANRDDTQKIWLQLATRF